MTDKELQKHIDYINERFPTDHDELDTYSNILMKLHSDYEIPKKKYSDQDKMILQSLIKHIQNRLSDEFNKHGFFTPFCLEIQEILFMARELQCSLDNVNSDLEMAMLTFTMAFDFECLQKDIDTSNLLYGGFRVRQHRPI